MIKSSMAYEKEMRRIMKLAMSDEDYRLTPDEMDVLAVCAKLGYVNVKYNLKTADGHDHVELYENNAVTVAGRMFVANKKDYLAIIMTTAAVITAIATVISAVAVLL